MMGTTNTTGGGQQQTYKPQAQQTQQQEQPQSSQTFAQLQKQGMARPAPQAPQAKPAQQYGGSQQANDMRQRLQQQLQSFGAAPSRYDTQAFQQIRGAQAQNLQAEYQGQQKSLDEDLARRGLFSSSIGGGRLGDLAGQQARALSSLDAQLLQQAADTQAQDRAQLMQSGQGLAELAGTQDLQQFEANRVGQAAEFEQGLRTAEFGQQQYQQDRTQALQGAQAEQGASQFQQELGTRLGELTGNVGGQKTLAASQQGEQARQFDIQQRLQEQLGLGGLGVQQQEVGIKQQALQQQTADAAAERTLRESMQTRELTAAEKQQLTDITSRKELQTQQLGAQQAESAAERDIRVRLQAGQITAEQAQQERQLASAATLQTQQLMQQAQQFGLSLNEQQAARAQQFGLSAQELGLKTQQVQQEYSLQGQRITLDQAQNIATNNLEQQRITQQASQFGLKLSDDKAARAEQLGISQQQIAQEATRITNQNTQFGRQMTATEVQNIAQNNLEQARVNEAIASRGEGARQFNLEQSLRQAMGMAEATGYNYQPVTTGTSVGALGGTTQTLAREAEGARQSQANLDIGLRRQLGMSELAGYTYDPTGSYSTGQSTLGTRAQQTNAQMMQYQAEMAQSEYNSRLMSELVRVLASFPAKTA
jgi:hypothetical protein